MKIIVVDDDPNIRRSFRAFLIDNGHQVEQAADGEEALRLVRKAHPDLVLLDLRMPRKDGMSTLRSLATEQPDLPVIVISGTGQISEVVDATRAGAWDFIPKPIDDLSYLTTVIDKVVEKRDLRRMVRDHQLHLERQVAQRTAQLLETNQSLEQKTIALREVLNTIQEEKREFQRAVAKQIDETVLPLVQRAIDESPVSLRSMFEQIDNNLRSIVTRSPDEKLEQRFASLTPAELRICNLIRRGLSSKEIAKAEGISPETVDTHRKNIRRKLKIVNEQVNLATYVQSLNVPEK